MISALLRLLTVFAVLLMPAAMVGAPAAAASTAAAQATAEHCGEHGEPEQGPEKASAHCVSCSALPALEVPAPVDPLLPRTPMVLALVQGIDGITPDIATPPPKLG